MQDILSEMAREALDTFSYSNLLVAFDFDGTLAPIVDRPEDAALRPRTRELLQRLAARYPTVVIAGRSQEDLTQRLHGIALREVIGNHGLEPLRRLDELATQVRLWLPNVEAAIRKLEGAELEDKTYSVAVHFRHAPSASYARETLLTLASRLPRARAIVGKLVVNLLPEGAPHKGLGLIAALERSGCERALYVGDDESDEDVFVIHDPLRLLSIRVGQKGGSHAGYFIRSQEAIDELLRTLAERRPSGALRS